MHREKKKEEDDMRKRNGRGMILYKAVTTNFSSSSSRASAAQTRAWKNKRQERIHFAPRGAIRSRLSLPADICSFCGENVTRKCSASVNIHQVGVSEVVYDENTKIHILGRSGYWNIKCFCCFFNLFFFFLIIYTDVCRNKGTIITTNKLIMAFKRKQNEQNHPNKQKMFLKSVSF